MEGRGGCSRRRSSLRVLILRFARIDQTECIKSNVSVFRGRAPPTASKRTTFTAVLTNVLRGTVVAQQFAERGRQHQVVDCGVHGVEDPSQPGHQQDQELISRQAARRGATVDWVRFIAGRTSYSMPRSAEPPPRESKMIASGTLMHSGALRLAHRWTLAAPPRLSRALVREFIRPAVRAVPASMARRLGHCRISLDIAHATVASQWTETEAGLEVFVMTAGSEDQDIAMELLLCLGQALWKKLFDRELREYWLV